MKEDFPIFKNQKNLIYLDSAATSQKPQSVIDAITNFYTTSNANIHRGIYPLSEQATELYDNARKKVAQFINSQPHEVIFTRNTTEALNLVAQTQQLTKSDNVVTTITEHHSNFVPWQQICKKTGAEFRIAKLNQDPTELIDQNTKVVAVTQMSNVLGTINDIKEIAQKAHEKGAIVVVDAAQSVPHMKVDFQELDADFLAFSGHKMYGPTGIGILIGKESPLQQRQPFLYGGDMIKSVTEQETAWADLPNKFEAGTPNIAGAVGLAAAIDYINTIGINTIQQHEQQLAQYTYEQLNKMENITIHSPQNTQIISFSLKDIHPHDAATILAANNVCLRAGHHCCQPLMKELNQTATLRISFGIYNTKEDVDAFINALPQVQEVLQ